MMLTPKCHGGKVKHIGRLSIKTIDLQCLKKMFSKKMSFRTPDMAKLLRVSEVEADRLMQPWVESQDVVTCTVYRGKKKMTEYRKVGVIF